MGCGSSKVPGKIELYYMAPSAPCRSVMLTAHALGIKLTLKPLNLLEGEHLHPDFVKLNPAHTVPTLKDENFILWESRAICAYLVNKYGKNDDFYPKDPKTRAIVDSRLNFDQGVIWSRIYDIIVSMMSDVPQTEEAQKKTKDAFELFDKLLEQGQKMWVATNYMTIADFALVASISTAEAIGQDFTPYPNIYKWLQHAKKNIPGYKEANQDGLDVFKNIFAQMKAKKDDVKTDVSEHSHTPKEDEKKDDKPKLHIEITKEDEIRAADLIDEALKTPSTASDEEPKLNVHV